jgi:hypothetical protein
MIHSMTEIWKKHKGTIIASVLGACVGAIIIQTFNVINLTRSFRFEQNREILDSTRLGIGFMKQVENELNENLTLLLNRNYNAEIEFGKPHGVFDNISKLIAGDPSAVTNKAQVDAMMSFFESMNMQMAHVNKMEVPTGQLSTEVWNHGAPELADVDYDLLRDLSDYYMLVERINGSIKSFSDLQVEPGGEVSPEMCGKLNMMATLHNDTVAAIKAKNVVELKDKIEKEIQRLSNIRRKITEEAQ